MNVWRKSSFFSLAAVLALIAGSVVLFTSLSQAQPKAAGALAATYVGGKLHVSVPYDELTGGTGTLTIEVLDPENHSIAHLDRTVSLVDLKGVWEQEISLQTAIPLEDLVWHRLRYRFTRRGQRAPSREEIASISKILQRPVVHAIAQRSYISGADAGVRLVVTDAANDKPLTSGTVRIELSGAHLERKVLYTGKLNERGTTRAQFRMPAAPGGSYSVRYIVDTTLGSAETTQEIQLEDKASILLTTEKPLYQPGQTIHARALALDRGSHKPTANRALTFELEDSRANKVFRKITQTDEYGVASAEFALADEVNLGAYHLRALMSKESEGNAGAASETAAQNRSELTLQVERYVLPRFKVSVDFGGKDSRVARGYRPGDHVTGTVRANYFFGKALASAEVEVKATGADVSLFDAGTFRGKIDSEGTLHFDIRLPNSFAGHPLNQGAARILVEASVKDLAGHSETRGEPIVVSESPILITLVPESGELIPSIENQVYVLTSYPDGTPAQTDIRLTAPGSHEQAVSTDSGGIAVVPVHGAGDMTIDVRATDHEGNRAVVKLPLQSRSAAENILLRTDRAIYRAGDHIQLQLFSSRQRGSAFIDLVKDGQTIATHDVDVINGRAELNLTATPNVAGTLDVNAYFLGRDGRPVGDHRLVFIQPADELRIETSLDSASYKPGGEARIGFRVTNGRGEGVQAAMGLEIVDQAVFALAEKRPGLAKVFFYLEQEMMRPRYEIHSVGLPETVSPLELTSRRDRAAKALFSAAETLKTNGANVEFGRETPQSRFAEYAARYRSQLRAQVDRLAEFETSGSGNYAGPCDLSGMVARVKAASVIDAWGSVIRVDERTRWANTFVVRSAGPDGQFFNSDDLTEQVTNPNCPGPGSIRVRIEQGNGTRGGMPELSGFVSDVTGGGVFGVTVRLIELANGREHNLKTNQSGHFALASLPQGRYRLLASAPGFVSATKEFALEQNERAVATVVLSVGEVAEAIQVMAGAPIMQFALADASSRIALTMAAPESRTGRSDAKSKPVPAAATNPDTHVRSWFPEALYINPEIITDRQGRASITIPIADNITTWRMAMLASTKQGALGTGTSSLKVFQDFFTELDLPVTLTQGDQVSIPIAVYNYSGARGEVRLRLEQAEWFSLNGETSEKSLSVESDRVAASQFTIEAKRIGKFRLTLKSELQGTAKRADIIVREIEVVPNGREQSAVFNGRLDNRIQQELHFPANSISEANAIFVRLYPGPLSQIVEGMDSLLRMPYGCFEQTSSSTYPNVLALDYMKRTKKASPEVRTKAEGYIANGYQRLLTFEVPGGGFSWFGSAPANKILTAYGLMEFSDMSKVHDTDVRVIDRTRQWLAGQQQPDGSWKPDTAFINEGATNRYNSDVLRITAYIAWSLEVSGHPDQSVEKAKRYIETHLAGSTKPDVYTLAILANFAADYAKDPDFIARVNQMLLNVRTDQDDQVWWKADDTGVHATGASAIVETTGLAVQAFMKSGQNPAVVTKAMNFIVSKKDASGTWGTSQATIMALRALLLASGKGGATAKGDLEVLLNGRVSAKLSLNTENSDLLHQFVFKGDDAKLANQVEIRFQGEGSLAWQIAGRYFTPWTDRPAGEPLSIDVTYDRTRLEQDELATANAIIRNNLPRTASSVMVDLGIPPGFELLGEDLDTFRTKSAGQKSGRLEKFSLTPTQAILYFNALAPHEGLKISYRLRAKYPIRTKTLASRVYEYYSPEWNAIARPIQLEVRKR